jgi:hypothetical protein
MTEKKSADRQANEYLYELRNMAAENGFKPSEKWQLNLASAIEKAAIEKKYHATVAAKTSPEDLSAVFLLVQEALKQPETAAPDKKTIDLEQLEYLIAFCPEREKR